MFPSLPVQAVRSSFSTQPFKRQQLGLMHGAVKQYGNNVPHSMNKTRRNWLPNIQTKRLFSRTLNEWIKVDLTARALRCIDKNGGIDDYIMNTKADLLGWEGMRIRVRLRDHIKEQQRKLAQGLPVTTSSVPRWSKASPPVQGTFATTSV